MKVVITGAFGFLGSHVIRQCARLGFSPIVLERNESKRDRLGDIDFISVKYNDLEDENVIESIKKHSPQSFIHIAWKGVDGTTRNDQEQITYNLPFSLKTIEIAKKVGCQQWIGIGSLSEYGRLTAKATEEICPDPLTMYAKAKLATCWGSSALCQAHNLKWSWIRLGSIFGPGDADHWLIPYVFNSLINGVAPKLTPSEQIWDYLYVTDAADAILSIARTQAQGIFNLGSGNEITIKELVKLIAKKINPPMTPEFGARPYHAEQIMYMVADINKIIKTTGWMPSITLSQGIDKTFSSLSNNHL